MGGIETDSWARYVLVTVCKSCWSFVFSLPLQHVAVSSGSGQSDLERLTSIIEAIPLIKYICLDVANGYSEHFVEFVKNVRAKFPSHTIMVGG